MDLKWKEKFYLAVVDVVGKVIWWPGGRDFPYLDCYGLVHYVFQHGFGIELFDLRDTNELPMLLGEPFPSWAGTSESSIWAETSEPSIGIVAAWRDKHSGLVFHSGLMVDAQGMLHVSRENPFAQVQRLSELREAFPDVDFLFYRHGGLPCK